MGLPPGEYSQGALANGDQVSVWVKNSSSTESYSWSGTLVPGSAPVSPTPVPPGKVLAFSSPSVAAGGHQTATVAIKSGSSVVLVIDYSNGKQQVLGPIVAGTSRRAVFTWEIPKSVSGTAHVTLDSPGVVVQGTFSVS